MLLVLSNAHIRSNAYASESDALHDLVHRLRNMLPVAWSVCVDQAPTRGVDAMLTVAPEVGTAITFAVEYKSGFAPKDVDALQHLRASLGDRKLLVLSAHFSERSRRLLKDADFSYFDASGNVLLAAGSLFIERTGEKHPPKLSDADSRPRTSLRGPITGRVIRFLCDNRSPLKVREIAAGTNLNPGNVSRILTLLTTEKLIARSPGGAVSSVDWEDLIASWSRDLQKERVERSYLEPHGIDALTMRLSAGALPYAITGPFAAALVAPAAFPLTIDVYVRSIEDARTELSLRDTDRIGNIRLIEAYDRVVFENTITTKTGLIMAAPPQIATDMLTLPARSRDEFNEFILWMKRHESVWRN